MARKRATPKKNLVASVLVVYRDAEGDWRWSARAGNYETVADSSEGYVNKMYALKMAKNLFPGVPYEFH